MRRDAVAPCEEAREDRPCENRPPRRRTAEPGSLGLGDAEEQQARRESQQDAATALSGSGPAYFYFLVEAMTDAGILLGLPRDKAHDLIVQAAIGAAVMLRDSGEHPVKLRENVTSPAGTPISAIRELENHGVRAALIAALEAARDRSRELASGTPSTT